MSDRGWVGIKINLYRLKGSVEKERSRFTWGKTEKEEYDEEPLGRKILNETRMTLLIIPDM